MKHICLFTGARPNFIKVAPLIHVMERNAECQYQLVYAGTADDPTLESSLFADLQIRRPLRRRNMHPPVRRIHRKVDVFD